MRFRLTYGRFRTNWHTEKNQNIAKIVQIYPFPFSRFYLFFCGFLSQFQRRTDNWGFEMRFYFPPRRYKILKINGSVHLCANNRIFSKVKQSILLEKIFLWWNNNNSRPTFGTQVYLCAKVYPNIFSHLDDQTNRVTFAFIILAFTFRFRVRALGHCCMKLWLQRPLKAQIPLCSWFQNLNYA